MFSPSDLLSVKNWSFSSLGSFSFKSLTSVFPKNRSLSVVLYKTLLLLLVWFGVYSSCSSGEKWWKFPFSIRDLVFVFLYSSNFIFLVSLFLFSKLRNFLTAWILISSVLRLYLMWFLTICSYGMIQLISAFNFLI